MSSLAWLSAVDQAHAAQASCLQAEGLRIARVAGGTNNALYRVEAGEEVFACKLCVADERGRARREYAALSVLQACGAGLAPQPILLDESRAAVPFPLVVNRCRSSGDEKTHSQEPRPAVGDDSGGYIIDRHRR